MLPKKKLPESMYVISSSIQEKDDGIDSLQQPEVYTTLGAANAAAQEMMSRFAESLDPKGKTGGKTFKIDEDGDGRYHGEIELKNGLVAARVKVWRIQLSDGKATDQGQSKRSSKAANSRAKTMAIKQEPEDEEEIDQDAEDEEEKPARAAKGSAKKFALARTSRKTIPKGIPGCLKGLKLLFTGTFDTMDRNTSIATAFKYGAEVITRLEDTDCIVLGTRAGPMKLKKINEEELETITEEEFIQILENGLSKEKRERMAARRAADAAEEPEEYEEPVKKKARR